MKKHGMAKKTKLYAIWVMMKQRCYNERNKDYSDYGERGIEVDSRWRYDYLEFHNWAHSNGYKDGLSLDRIDVDGNYEPCNCRWATVHQQANNKRNTIRVEICGGLFTITDLSRVTTIPRATLEMRYFRGDRGERIVRPMKKMLKDTKWISQLTFDFFNRLLYYYSNKYIFSIPTNC